MSASRSASRRPSGGSDAPYDEPGLLLADLVDASARVAATRSRLTKREILADVLVRAAPGEVAVVAAYLSGSLPQQRIGLGWRSLPHVSPAAAPSLRVLDVDAALGEIAAASGPGSVARRAEVAAELYGRATATEQAYLGALLTGTLRQGSLEGPLLAAIGVAYDVPEPVLRRGLMFAGTPGPLALAAAAGGVEGVEALGLEVGRAIRPMLAASAKTVAEAFAAVEGERLVQAKLDGVRIQVHVRRDAAAAGEPERQHNGASGEPEVRIFTRSLDDITDRLPEVVELARALPVTTAVLDGEVLALDVQGRPQPFQVTGARTASSADPEALRAQTPLTASFFDLLHLDGQDFLDEPLHARHDRLAALVPGSVVSTLRTSDAEAAGAFSADVLAAGHEGVVVKDPASPYAAGRRGSGWVKVKPRRTLDLVVLAVEPGSGRRRGWLSNIHLGARDAATGEFVMVGKTFKGMTDAMLEWQTRRFRELEVASDGYVVRLRPEQVVEIAFDGVQRSRRYPGGVALRFARVLRYRDDKAPAEADTIDAVRASDLPVADDGQGDDVSTEG